MPWMRAIDAHFEMFGFKPGDRVYLRFNFDSRRVIISGALRRTSARSGIHRGTAR